MTARLDSVNWRASDLTIFAQATLATLADTTKTAAMQAYMKTDMPFWGVANPLRQTVAKQLKQRFPPKSRQHYERGIAALWRLPHREEKYLALDYAQMWPSMISLESLSLYERLIREGAWWDLVDTIAVKLVGKVRLQERQAMASLMTAWLRDENLWIRRTVLLSQIGHKKATNAKELFAQCLDLAHEKEFFIRKAIGWALREYSKTAPNEVRAFLLAQRNKLSPLSFREGAKVLFRQGLMQDLRDED